MRERRPSLVDAPTVGLRDITSKNPRFRLRAADTLGQTPPAHPLRDEAIRALLAALSDPEPLVRYNAALSLTELRAPGLREILEAMLADQHPMARQAAAIGLGELGDPAAVPALEEALREGSPELRFQAVASLWELCHDAAIPQVARALQDEDAEVRAQAASCISDHLRARAEQGRPVSNDVSWKDALAGLVNDRHPFARTEAALALSWLGDIRALPALLLLLRSQEHDIAAIEALERLNDPVALAPLQRVSRGFFQPIPRRLRAAAAALRFAPDSEPEQSLLQKHASKQRGFHRPLALSCLAGLASSWSIDLLSAQLLRGGAGLLEAVDAIVEGASRGLLSATQLAQLEPAMRRARDTLTDEEQRTDLDDALRRLPRR